MNRSLIICILRYYGIRHTREHVEQLSRENINGGNLFGVLRHLSFYGITAEAARVSTKDDYLTMPLPAIVQTKDENFLLVTSIKDGNVTVTQGGKHEVLTLEQLDQSTTGIVAMLSCTTPRDEQDYWRHLIDQWWHCLSRWMALPLVVSVVGTLLLIHIATTSPAYLLMLLLGSVGLALSIILHRQWTGKGNVVEKVCGWMQHEASEGRWWPKWLPASNCSSAHDTFAFNRWFDLSEVGGAYFATLLAILLVWPQRESMLWGGLLIVTTLSLPFTVWSLWWQFVRQKTWCPLCVGTQLLLWLLAIVCWCHSGTIASAMDINTPVVVGLFGIIWMAMLSLIQNIITPLAVNTTRADVAQSDLANLKGQRQVLDALWGMHVTLGGEARIEMAVSPTCAYCKKAEEELERMQRLQPGRYTIVKHWYPVHPGDEEIIAERVGKAQAAADLEWCDAHDIHSTPTIYVNGVLLPKYYSVKDLRFM